MKRRRALLGVTREIGHGLALELARLDHDLVLWGRRPAELKEAAALARSLGAAVTTTTVDVSHEADPATWQAVMEVNLTAPAPATGPSETAPPTSRAGTD